MAKSSSDSRTYTQDELRAHMRELAKYLHWSNNARDTIIQRIIDGGGKMVKKKKEPPFNEGELAILHQAAGRVWNYLAYDILQATAEEKGKDINAVTIPRDVVIEVTLDANRFEDELKRMGHPELVERWDKLDYVKEMIPLIRPAFPFTRYGL